MPRRDPRDAIWIERRHRRADLQLAELPADLAPHLDRQPVIAEARINHRRQVQLRPAVASLTVGPQLMLVRVQAAEGAEIDHRAAS